MATAAHAWRAVTLRLSGTGAWPGARPPRSRPSTSSRPVQKFATMSTQDEVGDRGRRLLADRADAAGRQRALGGVAEHRVLRVLRPDRVLVVGVERLGEVAGAASSHGLYLLGFHHEARQRLAGLRVLGEVEVSSGKQSCSSCGLPTGPTGNSAWFMSSAIALFGFCVLAVT